MNRSGIHLYEVGQKVLLRTRDEIRSLKTDGADPMMSWNGSEYAGMVVRLTKKARTSNGDLYYGIDRATGGVYEDEIRCVVRNSGGIRHE